LLRLIRNPGQATSLAIFTARFASLIGVIWVASLQTSSTVIGFQTVVFNKAVAFIDASQCLVVYFSFNRTGCAVNCAISGTLNTGCATIRADIAA
jgi:hypothetical protein